MCGTNMLQDKLVQAPRFELGSDELKVRCDTVSPYLDCFSCFLRALLLLRCEPAFRLFTNMANGFLGFIFYFLVCLFNFFLPLKILNHTTFTTQHLCSFAFQINLSKITNWYTFHIQLLKMVRVVRFELTHSPPQTEWLDQASLYTDKIGGEYWDRTSRARGGGFTVRCITIDASSP